MGMHFDTLRNANFRRARFAHQSVRESREFING